MKNISLFILLTLSNVLHAEYFDTFVGIEGGASRVALDSDDTDKGPSVGLRIGFIRDTGRLYLAANTSDPDNSDLSTATLNFDAITPRDYRFNESFAIRGFLGVHGGYAQINPDIFNKSSGVFGGGQGGILFDFPASITLEVGVKASWSGIDYGPAKLNNFQNAYLAFDYIF